MNAILKFVLLSVIHFTQVTLLEQFSTQVLLVSHDNSIIRWDQNETQTVLVRADAPVTAFDIHHARQQIFFAENGTIYRTPLYDLETRTKLAQTGRVGGGLAVDWVHHRVYWTDLTLGRVEVVGLDGWGRRIVHRSPHLSGSLALDPQKGNLFWLEHLHMGGARVMTSKMDGSHVKELYRDRRIPPDSPLAVDHKYKSVYFYKTNGSSSEQWQITYLWANSEIGGGVRLFKRNETAPSALNIAKDSFFYSNGEGLWSGAWEATTITVAFGLTSQTFQMITPKFTLLNKSLANASQIRVLSEVAQPRPKDDPCTHHHCGPHGECVMTGRGRAQCVCGFGFIRVDTDCREEGYIIDRTPTTIGRAALDGSDHTVLYRNETANIHAFDLHPTHRFVYWTDLAAMAIYRAPLDRVSRSEVIVGGVSAYGVAVDWLHGHLYWTEHSRIMISRLDGSSRMILMDGLDAPAAIAVDPVNEFIFWAECGIGRRLRRANLVGMNMDTLSDDLGCGTTLAPDPGSRTLFWVDRAGSISSRAYSADHTEHTDLWVTRHVHRAARGLAILDRRVLWTPLHHIPPAEVVSHVQRGHSFEYVNYSREVEEIRVMKSLPASSQTLSALAAELCEPLDCPGLCLTSGFSDPTCLCSTRDYKRTDCTDHTNDRNNTHSAGSQPYLTLLNTTAFSATLQCSGPLLTHPMQQPYIHIEEIDSLVPRSQTYRASFVVRVDNKNRPFIVDGLNPATTYRFQVRNRVTRHAFTMEVHTRPPPLAVIRLPEVTVPGIEGQIPWRPQGPHYSTPNAWQKHANSEYILLLVSKKRYTQSNSPDVGEKITSMIENEVEDNFIILQYYRTKEEFDDDPTMYMGNLRWGERYRMAMVQLTQYRGQYNLDIVYSKTIELPDPTIIHG